MAIARNVTAGRSLPVLLILGGLGVVAFAFGADLLGLGGLPGLGANQIALAVGGLAVLLSGTVLLLPDGARGVGEWLLIGVSLAAVALAADLVIIHTGFAGSAFKNVTVVAVSLGLVLTSTDIFWPTARSAPIRFLLELVVSRAESLAKFLALVVQLALLLVLVREFNLESEAFADNILPLAVYGFVIHSLLPMRYRLPFFLLLSLAGILGIFGLSNGIWLIALGLAVVGICHLPLNLRKRMLLLAAAAGGLALLRAGGLDLPWSRAIWPILGSMFMFRVIVYVYELKHRKEPTTLFRSLSYFFLLPNVVFPLFPVVDYSAFRRTYYDSDKFRIYQRGADWIFRGLTHLILYRFASYYLTLPPEHVHTLSELARYAVANFLLYLRVSGQFHIVVGILHLYGFHLPETHHLYYFASSFTDFWRRINIYWKDFMLKIVFYPAHFAMRKSGEVTRLVVPTILVFFLTWAFHSYQWFWLRGSILFSGPDFAFWMILGLFVVANTLIEARYGRKRTPRKGGWSPVSSVRIALKTMGTFLVICFLWSLWSLPSLSAFFALWTGVEVTAGDVAAVALGLLGLGLLFAVGHWWSSRKEAGWAAERFEFHKSALKNLTLIVLVLLVAAPSVSSRLGREAGRVIHDLKTEGLSKQDVALLERGYYEDLMGVDRFNSQLWEIYSKRPGHLENFNATEAAEVRNDFLKVRLVPNAHVNFMGKPFTTNRWGMRNRDCERVPPQGMYRLAVVGPSTVMGWGVGDEETFERRLEDRLNREASRAANADPAASSFEVLNFGVSAYSPLQTLIHIENEVLPMQPDSVIYVAHPNESGRAVEHLVERLGSGAEVSPGYLREVLSAAGVDRATPTFLAKRELDAFGDEIIDRTYQRIAEAIRKQGAVPIWLLLPRIVGIRETAEIRKLAAQAEASGLICLDLSDVYEDQDIDAIRLASWDWHPNAEGHHLIAERLYRDLRSRHLLPLEAP